MDFGRQLAVAAVELAATASSLPLVVPYLSVVLAGRVDFRAILLSIFHAQYKQYSIKIYYIDST